MARFVSDVLEIMRRAIGRRNENDPDSNDDILMRYINDFYSLTMSDDVKLFEQFGTLSFTIDESNTSGVYTFNDVGADSDFVNISQEAYISLLDPVNNSVSWNFLPIYQNPGEFYAIWGINNDEILIPGYPTNLLFYGNELVFRTIPNTAYLVKIFGYKKNRDFPEADDPLEFDRWLRFLAYGAAKNYAQDFRYEPNSKAMIDRGYAREKALMLTHTHNQIKLARCLPRF
jgi:hypothetical protein